MATTVDMTLTTDLTKTKRPMNAREMRLFFEGPGSRPCRTACGTDVGCPGGRKIDSKAGTDLCTWVEGKPRCILATVSYAQRVKEAAQAREAREAARAGKPARLFDPADAPDDLGADEDTVSLEELAEVEAKPVRRQNSWGKQYKANRR